MLWQSIYRKMLFWRVRNISRQNFVIILSFIVGASSGLAAILLKNSIHFVRDNLVGWFKIETGSYWFLAYPFIGILITVLFVMYVIRDNISHGVSRVLYSISKKGGYLAPHNTFSSIISSTITIGFGGSVGAEAPVVLTGASIGSNLARLFRMNYRIITLMIGCGTAGAIAAIFKAPMAGLIFTFEVLMLDLTAFSIVPLLISAVTAASISYLFLGEGVVFSKIVTAPFELDQVGWFILLGVFAGLISIYFTRASLFTEAGFRNIKSPFVKLAIGGILLGGLISLFPPLYGEGYNFLELIHTGQSSDLLNNSFFYNSRNDFFVIMLFLALVIFFKVFATAITTGSGGIGGIFAPTLFVGGFSGYLLARVLNHFSFTQVHEGNFSLVGMAGLMAGVMHAPLTAIFLIAELTGGYDLFIPLIVTATVSYIVTRSIEPDTVYTKRLAQQKELITHNKDQAVLTLMRIDKLIETDFAPVAKDASLGDLVKVISVSNRNVFPVTDAENVFYGVVILDKVRGIMFQPELYDKVHISDLMFMPPVLISPDESMDEIVNKFQDTGNFNLPVVKDGQYIGFISRARFFSAYRRELKKFSRE